VRILARPAFFLLLALARPAAATELVTALPSMTLLSLEGEDVAVDSLAAGEVILLDFWATWCLPCRKAFPAYAALEERYADEGFRVVTVSQDRARDQRKIARILKSVDVDFPVLLDPEEKLGRQLGVLTLPTSFLVTAEGEVHSAHVGYISGDERELEAEIRLLLGLAAEDD